MKIRVGFVSNSSTSSFCLLGYRLEDATTEQKLQILNLLGKKVDIEDPDDEEAVEDAVTEAMWDLDRGNPQEISVVSDDGAVYIGNCFAYVSSEDGGIDELEFDLSKLQAMGEKLKSLGDVLGQKDPKLFVGTVAS